MVVSLLLVSMLIGTLAALAALAICSLTSASLSPVGGALLGLLAGVTSSNRVASAGSGALLLKILSGLAAAGTAAVVVVALQ